MGIGERERGRWKKERRKRYKKLEKAKEAALPNKDSPRPGVGGVRVVAFFNGLQSKPLDRDSLFSSLLIYGETPEVEDVAGNSRTWMHVDIHPKGGGQHQYVH